MVYGSYTAVQSLQQRNGWGGPPSLIVTSYLYCPRLPEGKNNFPGGDSTKRTQYVINEKNWFIPAMRPLKYWRSAVKPLPVWLMTGNFLAYKECGTSVYPVTALSNGLQTILSIIRIAQDQQCVIRKESVNV